MIVLKSKYNATEARLKETEAALATSKKEADALRYELENLKRGEIPEKHRGVIKYVFTSTDGVKYYTWKNTTDIPATRAIQLQILDKISEMGMTPAMCQEFYAEMRRLAQNGELTQFFVVFARMGERFNLKTTPEILLEQAAVLYVREDEEWDVYDTAFASLKIEQWKREPETLAFFLRQSFKEYWTAGELSEESILSYLIERQRMSDRLRPVIAPMSDQKSLAFIATLTRLSTLFAAATSERKNE